MGMGSRPTRRPSGSTPGRCMRFGLGGHLDFFRPLHDSIQASCSTPSHSLARRCSVRDHPQSGKMAAFVSDSMGSLRAKARSALSGSSPPRSSSV